MQRAVRDCYQQLTWSYELSYTLKNLNFTFSYSHTKNNQNIAIAKFKDVFPNIPSEDNVTVQIPINLTSSDYFGVNHCCARPHQQMVEHDQQCEIFIIKHFNGNFGGTTLNNGKPAADVKYQQYIYL